MKKIPLLLIITSLVLAACGNGGSATKEGDLVITDPSKTIETNMGNEFQIVIESNPTTGYHWDIVGELDKTLEFVSNTYNGSAPVASGSGGMDVWTFKAVNSGKAHITLGYYPPSNKPTDPQQTVTFTVIVK